MGTFTDPFLDTSGNRCRVFPGRCLLQVVIFFIQLIVNTYFTQIIGNFPALCLILTFVA
jgi:hypothetical protein